MTLQRQTSRMTDTFPTISLQYFLSLSLDHLPRQQNSHFNPHDLRLRIYLLCPKEEPPHSCVFDINAEGKGRAEDVFAEQWHGKAPQNVSFLQYSVSQYS